MSKLNQVIAVVPAKKAKAKESETQAYHSIQKPDLFTGLSRVYTPKDEDGERLPPEFKVVQLSCRDIIEYVQQSLVDLFDVVATQDLANCHAKSDVVVDGVAILRNVPVTHLLFLEKQLTDLHTFVSKLPTLDSTEEWAFDNNRNCYVTKSTETVRTKKVARAFVKAEATKEHPAQVDVIAEDMSVGMWSTTKLSGAIPVKTKNNIINNVTRLKEAVVIAREEANSTEVQNVKEGQAILDYVFNGL